MRFNWKDVVRQVAPGLAGLFGGPLASTAVGALSNALLGKPDGTEEEVALAIGNAPPEILARIREADATLRGQLAQAGVKLEEIAGADRASARDLAKTTGLLPQIILSTIFVVGYFVLVGALMLKGIQIASELYDVFLVLIGVMTAAVPQILNFWFGSSRSSQAKDAVIGQLTR